MSTLSKIFVILNLVLAIAFATFAVTLYSKRVHYFDEKVKLETKLTATITQLETDKKTLEGKLTESEKKAQSENQRANQAVSESKGYAEKVKTAELKAADANNRASIATENMKVLITASDKMREELQKTRAIVVKASTTTATWCPTRTPGSSPSATRKSSIPAPSVWPRPKP